MQNINIAIDGPAGAGKSTVAKQVADHLQLVYVDTGAMYRALTFKALQTGTNVHEAKGLLRLLQGHKLELSPSEEGQQVKWDGENITAQIRQLDVTNHVSFVASHEQIRKAMVDLQRQYAHKKGVVMDGRDIGTHVLPEAEVKIFLTASLQERAKRRFREQKEKGEQQPLEQIEADMKRRDEIDQGREVAPLQKAKDAICVDTTGLSINEVVQRILRIVEEKMNDPEVSSS